MSTIYIGERQSGKTTMLIEMSEKTGATIVVATYPMAKYIQLLAARMGKKIPVPITVTNYIRLLASGGLGKSEKYLVDELQIWEQWSNVVDASLLRGGHPAGQIGQVYGIVEFKDGVRRVDPVSIKFCDEENADLCALVKHHEALRKGEVNAED